MNEPRVQRYVCEDCGWDSGLIVVRGTLVHSCQRKAERAMKKAQDAIAAALLGSPTEEDAR